MSRQTLHRFRLAVLGLVAAALVAGPASVAAQATQTTAARPATARVCDKKPTDTAAVGQQLASERFNGKGAGVSPRYYKLDGAWTIRAKARGSGRFALTVCYENQGWSPDTQDAQLPDGTEVTIRARATSKNPFIIWIVIEATAATEWTVDIFPTGQDPDAPPPMERVTSPMERVP